MKLLKKSIINLDNPISVYDIEVNSINSNFCLSNGVVVHNSKDIWDAVCGVVFNLYQNLDKAGLLSVKYKVEEHNKFMKERATKSDDVFQNMIQSLY